MAQLLSAEVKDLLTLQLIHGLGPRLTAALLERFGTARDILNAPANEIQEVPHVGKTLAQRLCQALHKVDITPELERIAQYNIQLLALGSADYPEALANIPYPPHLLYVRGTIEARDAEGVGIVGSRVCTAYGRRVAERIAAGLAQKGITVISGLARGIDGAAHQGALKAGGRTLAFLAGGLSKIYPPEHEELAVQVQQSGALISEAAMAMEPMAGMFPARNRLISGLSRGVVVIEANERSGALITATHAAEQGKTVFAVPGPVDSAASAGTNQLIRKGAILVRGVEDILEELDGLSSPSASPRPTTAPPGLDDVQRRIWELLADGQHHIDGIAIHLKLAVSQIAGAMLTLEMKKVIRRLPGNCYERC